MSKRKTRKSENLSAVAVRKISDRPAVSYNRLTGIICLSLVFANLVVFGQVLGFNFISFDDGKYVYQNPAVQSGLSKASIEWAFTTFKMGHWHPLTWLSYMLDFEIFGLHPTG